MRLFKSKHFDRWARKQGINDGVPGEAVFEMDCGLVDAKLGGNLYKKRVATGEKESAAVRE